MRTQLEDVQHQLLQAQMEDTQGKRPARRGKGKRSRTVKRTELESSAALALARSLSNPTPPSTPSPLAAGAVKVPAAAASAGGMLVVPVSADLLKASGSNDSPLKLDTPPPPALHLPSSRQRQCEWWLSRSLHLYLLPYSHQTSPAVPSAGAGGGSRKARSLGHLSQKFVQIFVLGVSGVVLCGCLACTTLSDAYHARLCDSFEHVL